MCDIFLVDIVVFYIYVYGFLVCAETLKTDGKEANKFDIKDY